MKGYGITNMEATMCANKLKSTPSKYILFTQRKSKFPGKTLETVQQCSKVQFHCRYFVLLVTMAISYIANISDEDNFIETQWRFRCQICIYKQLHNIYVNRINQLYIKFVICVHQSVSVSMCDSDHFNFIL